MWYFIFLFRLTVSYTEVVYPARILPNQSGKPVPETQKLAECIFDCRTLLQQILTDGLTVLQNSKASSYQQHKAGLSKCAHIAQKSNFAHCRRCAWQEFLFIFFIFFLNFFSKKNLEKSTCFWLFVI